MILQVIALSTVASFCSEQTGHQLFHRQSSYEMWKKRQGSGFDCGDLMKTWPLIGFQYKSFNSHNMFCGLVDLMRNSELQNTYRQGERGQFILPNVCRRNSATNIWYTDVIRDYLNTLNVLNQWKDFISIVSQEK